MSTFRVAPSVTFDPTKRKPYLLVATTDGVRLQGRYLTVAAMRSDWKRVRQHVRDMAALFSDFAGEG